MIAMQLMKSEFLCLFVTLFSYVLQALGFLSDAIAFFEKPFWENAVRKVVRSGGFGSPCAIVCRG